MFTLEPSGAEKFAIQSTVHPSGFVAQDTQLFSCSIEENLSYGLGRDHSKEPSSRFGSRPVEIWTAVWDLARDLVGRLDKSGGSKWLTALFVRSARS